SDASDNLADSADVAASAAVDAGASPSQALDIAESVDAGASPVDAAQDAGLSASAVSEIDDTVSSTTTSDDASAASNDSPVMQTHDDESGSTDDLAVANEVKASLISEGVRPHDADVVAYQARSRTPNGLVMSPNSSKSQPTLLTGSANYLEWKMETSIYIAGKGLEGHLDGSIQEPLEDTIAADGSEMVKVANKASDAWRKWRMDDMKCMSKIRERASKPILNSIGAVVNTAFDLFNILAQRYGKALGFTRLLAMNAIHQ
ncbi:hypothetical protein AeMF1_006561, partial [Aphanomyces euteiches]